ncbi:MAG: response regulator transcription factor [Anaerolineales bacterium]|nr:response regulator transcription factor [Anaerolineales bacterium]
MMDNHSASLFARVGQAHLPGFLASRFQPAAQPAEAIEPQLPKVSPQEMRVLVVDDDAVIRLMMENAFSQVGVRVFSAADGSQALRQFYAQQPNLIVLDAVMPLVDGFEICRRIRQTSDAPVILLTALASGGQIVRGLDSGADDFIVKPFNPALLLTRSIALLRRMQGEKSALPRPLQVYQDDRLVIDLQDHKLLVEGQEIRLTPTEMKLLIYLVERSPRVCTTRQILDGVWGWEYQDSLEHVHVYITHLRHKIELDPESPRYIQTEPGIGYRFDKQN